jgi:hypothetical protein
MFAVLVGVLLVAAACTSSSNDTTTTAAVAETTTTAALAETTTTAAVAETTTTTTVPAGSGSVWLATDAQQLLNLTVEEDVTVLPVVQPMLSVVKPILEFVDVSISDFPDILDVQVAVITPVGMYIPENGVFIPEGGNGCMIADASVVVLTDDVAANDLEELVGDPQFMSPDEELSYEAPVGVADLTLVRVPGGRDALGYVVDLLAAGIPAWPHYAVNLGARWQYGPATAPTPVPSGTSLPDITTSQEGDKVTVIDAFDMDVQDVAAGHGDFIVGILKRLGVSVSKVNAQFYGSPISSEMEIASLITEGINNLSLGSDVCAVQEGATLPGGGSLAKIPDLNDDGDMEDIVPLPPIALAHAIIAKSELVVAAAGNDSVAGESCLRPWIPAAYADFDFYFPQESLPVAIADQYAGVADKVVSVGASGNPDIENRASFSNCGGSTVFAPGIGIISDGPEVDGDPVIWSGSSFATPIITGLIARAQFSP